MKDQTRFNLDLQLFAEGDQEETTEKVDPNKNFAEIVKELKANTVPKEVYEKLEQQNKDLYNAILNGESVKTPEEVKPQRESIENLRKELYVDKKRMTNLEYWTKTLSLREQLMELGQTDPFAPVGRKVKATSADFNSAQSVADGIKECIEAAGGDPIAFNNELRRRGLD